MAWKVAAAIMLVQGFDLILLLAMWRAFGNATLVMSTNFRDHDMTSSSTLRLRRTPT